MRKGYVFFGYCRTFSKTGNLLHICVYHLGFKSGDHQKLSLVNIHDVSDKTIMQPNTVSG